MKKILFKGKYGKSLLLFDEKIKRVGEYIKDKNIFIITDDNVYRLYRSSFPKGKIFSVAPKETSKSIETLKKLYLKLIKNEFDRSGFILGIGGGTVSDITGFVGATFMRGVKFGFIPTTILAQTDASVGGKNGINIGGYKNMVGSFKHPSFILYDFSLLKSLPGKEIQNGFAEIIKHGIIGDRSLFKLLEDNYRHALEVEEEIIKEIILKSVKVKLNIVKKDEFESGKRRILNFGHTFGHAIEKLLSISHGRAVAIGMIYALQLSKNRKLISEHIFRRIINLIKKFGFDYQIKIKAKEIIETIKKDKKKEKEYINFVFLEKIGKPIIKKISIDELKEDLNEILC